MQYFLKKKPNYLLMNTTIELFKTCVEKFFTLLKYILARKILLFLIQSLRVYRVFQKFVPIVYCILRKAFNASLGKFTLIQVRDLCK